MKKILSVLAIVLFTVVLVACQNVNAMEVTTLPVTTIPDTTITQTTEVVNGNVYYYDSYEDLVNQIYTDVKAEVYDDMKLELTEMLTTELYESIYQTVLDDLSSILNEDQIGVYFDTLQQKIFEVVEIANHSVIGVTSIGTDTSSVGSGVVYKHDLQSDTYYIITNHHVIENGINFSIVFANEDTVPATLLGYDDVVDIAILSFSGANLNQEIVVSHLGDSSAITQGTFALAAGNPRGYDFYGSVTLGIVSGLNRDVQGDESVLYIQHDASINNGNSGGPLYNLEGDVIGINVIKLSDIEIEGMGFSIPINMVKDIIARIEAPYQE